MKYTKLPDNAFKIMQQNVGILLRDFDPSTEQITASSILGPTTGGVEFEAAPSFVDKGEDIDNCPNNMLEFKQIESWEVKLSGTFVGITPALAKTLVGAGVIDSADQTKIVPRNTLDKSDFEDIWWVSDYSLVNDDGTSEGKAGMVAIHLMNALSTAGFKAKSEKNANGQFEFEFMGHYSLAKQDTVPFEIYIREGKAEAE